MKVAENVKKDLSDGNGGGGLNGGGGGGWNGLRSGPGGTSGGDGGGESLLLLSVGSCLSLNLFNRFLVCLALVLSDQLLIFFATKSSLRREPTIGFSASKVEISSKTKCSVFVKYFYW